MSSSLITEGNILYAQVFCLLLHSLECLKYIFPIEEVYISLGTESFLTLLKAFGSKAIHSLVDR